MLDGDSPATEEEADMPDSEIEKMLDGCSFQEFSACDDHLQTRSVAVAHIDAGSSVPQENTESDTDEPQEENELAPPIKFPTALKYVKELRRFALANSLVSVSETVSSLENDILKEHARRGHSLKQQTISSFFTHTQKTRESDIMKM